MQDGLFLEKKAVSGHHVPSTPTGKPLWPQRGRLCRIAAPQ